MANTTVFSGTTAQITGLDADWLASVALGLSKCFVKSIQFVAGAINDRMIVHDKTIDGAPIFDSGPVAAATSFIRVDYIPLRPCDDVVIDISDCTLGAGTLANCKVLIEFA